MIKRTILMALVLSMPLFGESLMNIKRYERKPRYPNLYLGIAKTITGLSLLGPTINYSILMVRNFNVYVRKAKEYEAQRPAVKAFVDEPKEPSFAVGFIPTIAALSLLIYDGISEIIEATKGPKKKNIHLNEPN